MPQVGFDPTISVNAVHAVDRCDRLYSLGTDSIILLHHGQILENVITCSYLLAHAYLCISSDMPFCYWFVDFGRRSQAT
jgi:hypothetical protein